MGVANAKNESPSQTAWRLLPTNMTNLPQPFDAQAQHFISIRVYYEDTDFTGMVYHANYLTF